MVDVLAVKKSIDSTTAALKRLGDAASHDMASDALNHVAFFARLQLQGHIKSIFNKPVSRTVNSPIVFMATPNKPEAKVFINDNRQGGASPAQYLMAQETGGNRRQKRMENALKIAGIMKEGQQIYGVDTDAAGNLSGARVKKMIAAIQGQNADDRNAVWRVARRKDDGQPFGIFNKNNLFLTFTRKQKYTRKFKFFEVVQEAWSKKIKEAWAKSYAKHVSKVVKV